jgi:hypothetical protein
MNLALSTKVALLTLTVGAALVTGYSCSTSPAVPVVEPNSASTAEPNSPHFPMPSPTPENTSLADKPPQYLCDHLDDLKQMAWDPSEHSGDAVYDALKRNGYYAMPCLVNKITDTRPADNPTGAPFWAGLTYRVGDTAVLMLMDINNMYWPKGMLPPKYEGMFKDEGMFAYYFYVHEVPGARKQVQRWWREWMKTCQPECAVIPSIEK